MSDQAPTPNHPPPLKRKTAAEQAAEQKAAQGGVSATGDRTVEQTMVRTVQVPVKAGQTVSDAVKDLLVEEGGFEGEGIKPGPSGAIIEQEIWEGQEEHMSHPAIDSNPRRGVSPTAIQRDMNDPTFDRPAETPEPDPAP